MVGDGLGAFALVVFVLDAAFACAVLDAVADGFVLLSPMSKGFVATGLEDSSVTGAGVDAWDAISATC